MRENFDDPKNRQLAEKVYKFILKIRNSKKEIRKQIRKLEIEDKKEMKPKRFVCSLVDPEGNRADPNTANKSYVGSSMCSLDVRPRWPESDTTCMS